MSPAGAGRDQFHAGVGARIDRGNPATPDDDSGLRKAQCRPVVSVCTWMLPWLLPAGLLATVVLISLPGASAFLLAGIWGWLVFAYAAVHIHVHARADGNGNNWSCFRDGEADYWRTKLM